MAKRQSTDSRIFIADTAEGLRIVMPCRRSLFVIAFLVFWLCGWGVGEIMVANQLWHGDAPAEGEVFMATWLGVWTMGGVIALYACLWQLMGKEILTARGPTFRIRRDIGGFGLDKEYNLSQMQDLRIASSGVNSLELSSSFQLWGVSGGVIAFDHGKRTYRFGAGLDEAEAKQIVTAIKQRFRVPESTPARDQPKRSPFSKSGLHADF